jgi:PAS domain S-box-containing protein
MRNMGTMSSMSISIVCEGRLWGLISGHHATPLLVPYLIRSACDLLTKMVSTQLTAFKTTANLRQMVTFQAVQRNMLTQMAAENNYLTAILARMEDLIQVTNAEGAALIVDGQCWLTGQTPGEDSVLRLANWMDAQPDLKLFETPHLPEEIGWANEISSSASGLLAISISDVRQSYLMWFRPELVRTVKWAGEPVKLPDQMNRLHPRTSFNTWKELVRGQSEQWTEMEIESAREFRAAVMTISLKRAEESADLNEARFEQLTHTLPNLIWTADDNGHLTYVNQKWRDEGLGDQGCWYEQARLADEDRQWCGELWKAAVNEEMPFEAEMRFRRLHDDTERWNLVRAIPFLRANRTRAGWVGTCTDLTDRRERELALGMTEKLALTGRMTSVIAHEINNPLEAITNLLYLLKIEVPRGGPAMNYIGMAESELQRISGITKQTLRWSKEVVQKADHGTAGALFEDVKLIYAGKIRNRGLTIIMAGGDDTPVFGIIGQLQQVVANLVSNAIDAVPVGGRIWLSAISKGETFEIIVRDEGPGISPEMLRQIFKPFYSTKGDLGNGLGLYISQEIVERHAGKLIVETVMGEGTTIRVSLPAHPTHTSASLPDQAAPRD